MKTLDKVSSRMVGMAGSLALRPCCGKRKEGPHFRFEDLEVWQLAANLAVNLHRLADRLEARKYFRYAEQLRAAGLSLPNNIAEGSASPHAKEFQQFLNITRRSLFEDASMVLVFEKLRLMDEKETTEILQSCDHLSRKLTNLTRSLRDEDTERSKR